MREEGIVLENHCDITIAGPYMRNIVAADENLTFTSRLKTCNDPQ